MAVAQPPDPLLMSEIEYLEFDTGHEIKHEYVNGHVIAMTGASWNHNVINGNLQATLNTQLTDRDCAAVSNDMRLKVQSNSVSFRYPDTMVICGKPDFANNRTDIVTNPAVIVEVLSPTTALQDHNQKLDEYIQIPSVQHYVLISQHSAKVEVYTRQNDGTWIYAQAKGLAATVELMAINCTLRLAKLYEKVKFEQSD